MEKILLILFVLCGSMVVVATEVIEKFIFFGFGIGILSVFLLWRIFEAYELKAMEKELKKQLEAIDIVQQKKNADVTKVNVAHSVDIKAMRIDINKLQRNLADVAIRTGIDAMDNH